jgi:large subunit ribosomal protein L10
VPITKDKKKEIMARLSDVFGNVKSLVFVNFHGLNVATTSEMRRALRGADVQYFVTKKSLVKRALGENTFDGTAPDMPGELALAWSEDLIAPAREIYSFQKKNPDNVKIVGGIFEGKFMNQVEMMEIATIPALPVLHGKFVNIINSPIQRFVIGLGAIAAKKSE